MSWDGTGTFNPWSAARAVRTEDKIFTTCSLAASSGLRMSEAVIDEEGQFLSMVFEVVDDDS